jgi:hypothetical protein
MSRGSQLPLGDRLAAGPRGITSTLAQLPPLRLLLNALARLPLSGHHAVIGLPYLWLGLFFLVPFVIVLKISFSTAEIAMPPYAPLLHWVSEKAVQVQLDFSNFMAFLPGYLLMMFLQRMSCEESRPGWKIINN